jgi:hypothetical protein
MYIHPAMQALFWGVGMGIFRSLLPLRCVTIVAEREGRVLCFSCQRSVRVWFCSCTCSFFLSCCLSLGELGRGRGKNTCILACQQLLRREGSASKDDKGASWWLIIKWAPSVVANNEVVPHWQKEHRQRLTGFARVAESRRSETGAQWWLTGRTSRGGFDTSG